MALTNKELKDIQTKESRVVKGTFMYHEQPGGTLKFCFRKFKGEPISKWEFKDGEEREVPFYIAKHLKESGIYKTNVKEIGPDGKYKASIPVRRYSFDVYDFIEPYSAKDDIIIAKPMK